MPSRSAPVRKAHLPILETFPAGTLLSLLAGMLEEDVAIPALHKLSGSRPIAAGAFHNRHRSAVGADPNCEYFSFYIVPEPAIAFTRRLTRRALRSVFEVTPWKAQVYLLIHRNVVGAQRASPGEDRQIFLGSGAS